VNYLELCRFAHRYIQGGDDLPGTAPDSVVGQEGYLFELVMSVAYAYESIQNSQDQWLFMQKRGTFNLSAGQRTLTNAEVVAQIPTYEELRPNVAGGGYRYCQFYSTAVGVGNQTTCMYVPYQQFRGQLDNNTIPTGRSNLFTVQPDGTIEFNFIPDQPYSFDCDFMRSQDVWVQTDGMVPGSADAQTPIFPTRFHQAIAWRAILLWAGSIASAGKYGFANNEYERIMGDMLSSQLPELIPFTGAYYEGAGIGGGG
jgi:hypothetical protein